MRRSYYGTLTDSHVIITGPPNGRYCFARCRLSASSVITWFSVYKFSADRGDSSAYPTGRVCLFVTIMYCGCSV